MEMEMTEQARRMRAVPGHDAETGCLVRVTLTDRPAWQGAGIGVLTPRPDLDAAVEPPPGWHWFECRGEFVCRLAPTDADVLVQVADDLSREATSHYRLVTDDPLAEQLREIATGRMARSPEDAGHLCELLLRRYEAAVPDTGEP